VRSGRSQSLCLSIGRVIKQIVVIIGASLLPTTYKILSNILLSRLTPYAVEIIGDHPCGLRCNWSTTDHIYCMKKWEYNEAVHQ